MVNHKWCTTECNKQVSHIFTFFFKFKFTYIFIISLGETPLHYAIRISRKDIIELFLENGADRHKEAPTIGSPLSLAKKTDPDLLAFIRDFSSSPMSRKTSNTPLRVSIPGDDRDEHGQTPLHIAASEDRLDQVFSLLLKNASVNDTDKNGWTPMHCAACNGHLDVLVVLTNSYGVNVNIQTNSGSTVLHYLMRLKHHNTKEEKENYIRVLNIIKSKGASLNIAANRGIAPIHEATLRGNILAVQWLIDQGAKLNNITEIGFTPLHFAVQSKTIDVVKLLVNHNANPSHVSQAGTPISMAKELDQPIFNYLSSVPATSTRVVPTKAPARPPRKIMSSTHRTSSPSIQDLSTPEDDEEDEVIYSIDEQGEDEDVPGSVNAVIPLAQRRCSTIINTSGRASYSVIFSKPPVG